MYLRAKITLIILLSLFGLKLSARGNAGDVVLYTPYVKISVPPGESVDYSIDIINKSTEPQTLDVSVWGLPRGWNYQLRSGGWNIKQISVLPGEKKTLSLKLEVPLKINKGTYRFFVKAGDKKLSLSIIVSKQGTYKTIFTSDQKNMQGNSKSKFTFRADLKNMTDKTQLYSLRADAPRGWEVLFKPDYHQATSVEIKPNETKHIAIHINPPDFVKAGTYKIPVFAVTQNTSANMVLEVVITGTYDISLTTPTGLLSSSAIAGEQKKIEFVVHNNGSAKLNHVKLTASSPLKWEVEFDPKEINHIDAGKEARVFATVTADKKAIPGDYLVVFKARTPEVSTRVQFRIMVKTSMLWGWIGVVIILFAIGFVVYLFRKYGRR